MINLIEVASIFIGASIATYSYSLHELKKMQKKQAIK